MTRKAILLTTCVLLAAVFVFGETTFYEAYRMGLLLAGKGQWVAAREHFLEAVSMNPTPGRRIKTYGLNFVREYDPYFQLTVCELHLGLLKDAAQHLETSRKAQVTPPALIEEAQQRLDLAFAQRNAAAAPAPQPAPAAETPPVHTEPETPAEVVTTGTAKLDSSPSGASITINGNRQGATPLQLNLPAGSYEVQWQLEGYQTAKEILEIKPGETQSTRVVLNPVPPPEKPAPVTAPVVKPKLEPQQEPAPVDVQPPQEKQVVSKPEPQAPAPVQKTLPQKVPAIESGHKGLVAKSLAAGVLLLLLVLLGARIYAKRPQESPTVKQIVQEPRTPVVPEDTPTQALGPETIAHQSMKTPSQRTPTPVPDLESMLKRAQPLSSKALEEISGYKLEGVLGRGGMGTTYLAVRTRDRLPVAIKIPHEHLLDNPEFAQRFLREASLGSTLHHPNIIRVYDAGVANGKPFIVMELIQGETLESKLRRDQCISIREALEITRDIALALDYARLKGIVHRDLKPENIMLPDRGGVKVMDYGIARIVGSPGLTATEAFLGTPAYSSPEATGGEVDQQSDLYSLGILLYRMLCGELPFQSKNVLEVLDMHRSKPIPAFSTNLKIPTSVHGLVTKLTAKAKGDRFANAESFLIELNRILNELD